MGPLLGLALLWLCAPMPPSRASSELLVVLTETGETRDDLPVFELHPDPVSTSAILERGLSGTLLRVYRRSQHYLEAREGLKSEPAYILLSERQGGFARVGFYLGDQDKSSVGYVDVHRDWPLAGRFGAIDQIFPHELAHVMRRQLAGELGDGGANQVHALALRTDRITAFNEGYAEHLQAVAIDHPDAEPATRVLASDDISFAAVDRQLAAYRRELEARWSIAPRMRLGFVAWYSNAEDVQRFSSVKANAFAHSPAIPERLLRSSDPYRAYLLEGIVPARPTDPAESVARRVSKEGVVSAFFYRWAHSEVLRSTQPESSFYQLFGLTDLEVDQLPPLENVYLKLVHALYEHRPQDVTQLVEGYRQSFPEEAAEVERLSREVFGSSSLAVPTEIWLANRDYSTGTTIFDQFRGLARPHTFDLNAASPVDLVSVPGVDLEMARRILDAAPYAELGELATIGGVGDTTLARFETMGREMERLRAEASIENVENVISLQTILLPYAWRALATLLVATLAGAVLHALVRARLQRAWEQPPLATRASRSFPWWRSLLNGFGAALVGLVAGWAAGPAAGAGSLAAVALLLGLPAGLLRLRASRALSPSLWVFAAWIAATLPAAAAVTPLL